MRKPAVLEITTPQGLWVLVQHTGNLLYSAYLTTGHSDQIACHLFAYESAAVVEQTLMLDSSHINVGHHAAAVRQFLCLTARAVA